MSAAGSTDATIDYASSVERFLGAILALTLCALAAFVITIVAFSGRSFLELHFSASLARYQAMTSGNTEPHRYFVLSDDSEELRLFAEREVLVSLITYSELTSTTTLELATPDAATLERLRALPSVDLVLNASAALLCR